MVFGSSVLIRSVSAGCSPVITPNPPTAGNSFVVSGTNACSGGVSLVIYSGSGCVGTVVFSQPIPGATGSHYSITVPGQLAGSYSTVDDAIPADCVNFTIDPAPIPEYPLGLPILAILTVIAYGLIKRKTDNIGNEP